MATRAAQFECLLSERTITDGYARFLVPGTTTAKTAWSDKDKSVAITKIALDVNGRAEAWGDGIYAVKFYEGDPDAGGAEVAAMEIAAVKVRATEGNTRTITTDTTGSVDDSLIAADTSLGNVEYELPDAALMQGQSILALKTAAANTFTVAAASGQTVNGAASLSFTAQYASSVFQSDGTSWWTFRQTAADLGVSAFGLTLIDDANGAAFLDTLIASSTVATFLDKLLVSAFIQTVLDDTDAETTRETIGAGVFVGTPLSTTTGLTKDFENIPAGVAHISLNFSNVSLDATGNFNILLGDSGGLETSGYYGSTSKLTHSDAVKVSSFSNASASLFYSAEANTTGLSGIIDFKLANPSTNTWVVSGTLAASVGTILTLGGFTKSLTGPLDRITIATTNSNAFDGGEIGISYQMGNQ